MLTAYVQASPVGTLRIWVGIFGVPNPGLPSVDLNGRRHEHRVVAPLRPIRDHVTGPGGAALNHRTVLEISGVRPDTQYRVEVIVGNERYTLSTATLPAALPQKLEGTFNILLCSCYSQPEDASGLLGTVVSQIKMKPQLTLMLGDQIYGDLPITENLPGDDAGVARKLAAKYFRNWTSSQLETGGLERVLSRAPVICVADDHEYWNNYPYSQSQLPKTWTGEGRRQWARVAKALYEDYQLAESAGGAQRIDVDPLKILVVDMRSLRDDRFDQLVPAATLQTIRQWADDLIQAKGRGEPAFGLFSSGQALFAEPANESQRVKIDAELGNYAQFEDKILPLFEELSAHGIPVVYITGDVHWGRVAQRVDRSTNRPMLYEVIASPSRMIRTPGLDRFKEAKSRIGGLFGKADPWPRHSEPPPVPDPWGKNRNFRLECDLKEKAGHAQRGDHIAIMSLARAGGGVDFNVTYYGVSADKALAKSVTTRTYELRVM